MILNIRFTKYLLLVLVVFIFTMIIFVSSSPNQSSWFGNIFSANVYIYQLIAVFLFGVHFIDQHFSTSLIIRMENREKAGFEQVGFKYVFAFVYLNIWFVLIVFLTIYLFSAPFIYEISDILNRYIHYLLGFMIIINLSEIFKKSEISALKFSPIPLAYLILIVEVLVIVPFIIHLNIPHVMLVFGWIFNKGIISFVVLIAIFAASLFYLLRYSTKNDMI